MEDFLGRHHGKEGPTKPSIMPRCKILKILYTGGRRYGPVQFLRIPCQGSFLVDVQ